MDSRLAEAEARADVAEKENKKLREELERRKGLESQLNTLSQRFEALERMLSSGNGGSSRNVTGQEVEENDVKEQTLTEAGRDVELRVGSETNANGMHSLARSKTQTSSPPLKTAPLAVRPPLCSHRQTLLSPRQQQQQQLLLRSIYLSRQQPMTSSLPSLQSTKTSSLIPTASTTTTPYSPTTFYYLLRLKEETSQRQQRSKFSTRPLWSSSKRI